MKQTILTLLCVALLSSVSFAQSLDASQVPPTVKKTLLTKHPGAREVEWEKNGMNFVAQFTQKDNWISATFDKTGAWIKSEMSIEETALPIKVKQKLSVDFSGFEVSNINKISDAKSTTYEITLYKEELAYLAVYDSEGNQSSKKKVEYEEEAYEDEVSDDEY